MKIIPTDLIAEKIWTNEGFSLGIIREVVINSEVATHVFLLVEIDKKCIIDTRSVVIPFSGLKVDKNNRYYFKFPVRLLKNCSFSGDHRALQSEDDTFYHRLVRKFEFWASSVDYLKTATPRSSARSVGFVGRHLSENIASQAVRKFASYW